VCFFCARQIGWVDYKDTDILRRFMTDRGKIKARANTGTCRQHQRDVALAIKTARELAMLPYLMRTLVADKSAGRRGRNPGRPGDRPPGIDDAPTRPTSDSEAAPTASPDMAVTTPAADIADVSADDAAAASSAPSRGDLHGP
jgi:ribosomal protein S18